MEITNLSLKFWNRRSRIHPSSSQGSHAREAEGKWSKVGQTTIDGFLMMHRKTWSASFCHCLQGLPQFSEKVERETPKFRGLKVRSNLAKSYLFPGFMIIELPFLRKVVKTQSLSERKGRNDAHHHCRFDSKMLSVSWDLAVSNWQYRSLRFNHNLLQLMISSYACQTTILYFKLWTTQACRLGLKVQVSLIYHVWKHESPSGNDSPSQGFTCSGYICDCITS